MARKYVDKRFRRQNCLAEFINVKLECFNASIKEIGSCPRSFYMIHFFLNSRFQYYIIDGGRKDVIAEAVA